MSPEDRSPSPESYVGESVFVELLGSKGKAGMLDVFVSKRYERLSGQEIADLADIDRSTFDRNIQTFLDLGIVQKSKKAGNAQLYSLNTDHDISKILGALQEGLLDYSEEIHGIDSEDASTGERPDSRSLDLRFDHRPEPGVTADARDVLRVLGNNHCPDILAAASEPRSARELSEVLDIPIATTYRRVDQLTEAGLLELFDRPLTDEPRQINVYQRRVDEITIEFVDEEIYIDLTTKAVPIRVDAVKSEEESAG